MGDDDDSEDDDDYVPPTENDSDDNDEKISSHGAGVMMTSNLSQTQQKAVDDAFSSLFDGKTYNYGKNLKSSNKTIGRAAKKALRKKKRVLADIFGGVEASKILARSSKTTKREQRRCRAQQLPESLSDDGAVTTSDSAAKQSDAAATALTDSAAAAAAAAIEMTKKQTVTEVKVFAGQKISVQQEQQNPSIVNTQATTTTKRQSNLDAVLSNLAGPQKLSTVAKTSIDWDSYKGSQLSEVAKDELETKAEGNDAFLVKKDFLQRVDLRRFEVEKEERERKRVAAALAEKRR